MHETGRIVLTGKVSEAPVLRATLQRQFSTSFSLTTITRRMNRAGAYTDREKRYNIVATGELAISVRNSIRKGNEISVEGKYRLRQWEDKASGETKYLTQVLIDRYSFAEPDQLALPMAA